MPQRLCVSLRQIKEHEIHTTLRYVRKHGAQWSEIYLRYGEIQKDLTQKLIKTGASLLLYYFLLSALANETHVSVTLQGYTAAIPTAYVTLIASTTLYFFILQFQSLWMLLHIRARESSKIVLRGFSPNSYGFLMNQDDMALVTPIHSNGFFKERFKTSSILTIFTVITTTTLLIPIVAFVVFLLLKQIEVLKLDDLRMDYFLAICIGSMIISFSVIFVILFNIPLPVSRNSYSIRWGLLARLHPIGSHPRLQAFLDDDEINSQGR